MQKNITKIIFDVQCTDMSINTFITNEILTTFSISTMPKQISKNSEICPIIINIIQETIEIFGIVST